MRVIFFIILPATAGLIALRTPVIQLLFERGEFDAVSTARTSFVVLCYTIGLFAYSGQKIIVTGFYSLQDTKTPMKVAVVSLLLNVVFNFLLMGPLKEGGLALATSISGIFNFICLVLLFQKRIANFPFREILVSSARILLASLVTGWFSWQAFQGIYGWTVGDTTFRLLVGVFGSIGMSLLLYAGLCFLLQAPEIHDLVKWIRSSRQAKVIERVGEEPL